MGIDVWKWIYELGVKHERRRIASYLTKVKYDRRESFEHKYYPGGSEKDISEARKRERDMQMAVNYEVDAIINAILLPEAPIYQPTNSIMFPKGDQ
jgi:hypothetical protein